MSRPTPKPNTKRFLWIIAFGVALQVVALVILLSASSGVAGILD